MIVAGLLVLLAVGTMGIARITAYNGTSRSSPFRFDVPGYHLQGPGSRLFFFGLLVGVVAMLGLSTMMAGLGRGFRRRPASRQLLTGSPSADKRPAGAKRPAHSRAHDPAPKG
jgi:ABC-type Na+ efflux pump permease subunit